MPARVDPVQRRRDVVDAAFRCVVAEGFEGASLRKVATQAGLNVGSVRHFFDGHEDLLVAAATEAGNRMDVRLGAHSLDPLSGADDRTAVETLQLLIEEVLPMDPARRDEAIVVVEFVLASRLRPALASLSRQMHTSLHDVIVHAYDVAAIPDHVHAARQTTALIGGLTLDAITPHGELPTEEIRSTLHTHLSTLVATRRTP